MSFNSYLFRSGDGLVAVDPLEADGEVLEWMASLGGVHTIVITNRDHQRAAPSLASRFRCRIVDAAKDGEEVFPGAFAVPVPFGKSPEFAVHLRAYHAAIIGDALIGSPAGSLSLLPDEKLEDPQRFVFALRRIWGLQLEALLLGDGQPLFSGADALLGALLEKRGGAAVNRINLDELTFAPRGGPEKYVCEDGEAGLLIGARQLGYRVVRIAPGKAFCPLHWHEANEEFFYVMEGTPSIRTGRGTIVCRPGDFIAFPCGERGAHQVINESARQCLVLLAGMNQTLEACFYPDSNKVMVQREAGRLLVRSSPAIGYFDGE
jgi:uncharacterized cupin superfamily protein